MTRVLKASTAEFDVCVVPAFTRADLDRAAIEVRAAHGLPEGADFPWPGLQLSPIKGGLEWIFLWVLKNCYQFAPAEATEVFLGFVKRERLGGTGCGRGQALPHTRTALVKKVSYCVLRLEGFTFDFDGIDGLPVWLFAMHLIPPDRPGDNLRGKELVIRKIRHLDGDVGPDAIAALMAEAFSISAPWSVLDV